MHFLIYIIIAMVVGAIYTLIMQYNAKELLSSANKQDITVHLPGFFGWVGASDIIFSLAAIILMSIFPNDTCSIWVYVVFCMVVFLGILILLASLVWKIHIYKDLDYLVYITFFGRSYKILYSDITYFKPTNNTVFIKVNRKTFFVDRQATNIEILFEMFRKYRVKEKPKRKYK